VPFFQDTFWPGFLYCLKYLGFGFGFTVLILNEGNDCLTNNMQTLYIIDQSRCVRRWDLERIVKSMQIRVHNNVSLEAALSIPIGV